MATTGRPWGAPLLCFLLAVFLPTRAAPQRQQVLKLRQVGCARVGQEATVAVDYSASAGTSTTAVSFKVELESGAFDRVAQNASSAPQCELKGLVRTADYVAYTCASFVGKAVVPARVDDMITIRARVLARNATLTLSPNRALGGTGYSYSVQRPSLALRMCGPPPTPAPTLPCHCGPKSASSAVFSTFCLRLKTQASCHAAADMCAWACHNAAAGVRAAKCEAGSWGTWTTCSRPCGGGLKRRSRARPLHYASAACAGTHFTEEASCNAAACAVDAAAAASPSAHNLTDGYWHTCSHVKCRYEWMADLHEYSTVVERHWAEQHGTNFHCEHDGTACSCLCHAGTGAAASVATSEIHHYDQARAANSNGKRTWRVQLGNQVAMQRPAAAAPSARTSPCKCAARTGKGAYAQFCSALTSTQSSCEAAADTCEWACDGKTAVWQHTRVSVAGVDPEAEVLELTVHSKRCVVAGDTAQVHVAFRTTDGQATNALAFKLKFDAQYWSLAGRQEQLKSSACEVNGFSAGDDFVSYMCGSTLPRTDVPASASSVISVALRATGKVGSSAVSIVPNTFLPGEGYTYRASAPIDIASGVCNGNNGTPATNTAV